MVSIKEFKNFDIRIAEVLEAGYHPNADKLYVLRIKVGEEEKQIVAGIRRNYQAAELVGKKIVVVNNLEPATIRGVESNGMLLAASDGNQPVLLIPDRPVPSGAPIS